MEETATLNDGEIKSTKSDSSRVLVGRYVFVFTAIWHFFLLPIWLKYSFCFMGRYCGSVGPRIVSSSNLLVVRFTSDHWVRLAGFSASYRFVEQQIGEMLDPFKFNKMFTLV